MNTCNICHGCAQVLHVLHLTQGAQQPEQQIVGNKLTADQFQSEYEALFREKGFVADFGFDPNIDPHHAPRTSCYSKQYMSHVTRASAIIF